MIELRPFGRTGHLSSRVLFGAAALGSMRQDRADEVLELVRDQGINHIDTAAGYGDSELRLAPFLSVHRHEVFLATKTGERVGSAARAELERSLVRLGVDSVDLIQLHNLVEDDEWDTAFGPGGALEALCAARDEGLVRAIGVTGHGLRIAGMHLRSLERFPFDSVLLPYNHVLLQNDRYRADVEALLERCERDGVAVQTIKAVARRRWQDDTTSQHSWYEPLRDPDAIARAVRFVLAHEQLFLASSSDVAVVPHILAAAAGADASVPPDPAELDRDVLVHEMSALFDGGALERI